jgi:hypothetical protein
MGKRCMYSQEMFKCSYSGHSAMLELNLLADRRLGIKSRPTSTQLNVDRLMLRTSPPGCFVEGFNCFVLLNMERRRMSLLILLCCKLSPYSGDE